MTIYQALASVTNYPIPALLIERVGVDRGLTITEDYTGLNQSIELAMADVYMFLYGAPDLKEQEVSITQADRDNYLKMANQIYGKYDDPNFSGIRYGFIGESLNG